MGFLGSFCFGLVIGWVTYRTLRRKTGEVAIGDIAAVIGAIGGATVVGLFKVAAFDGYCIGLAAGFFGYFVIGTVMDKLGVAGTGAAGSSSDRGKWMGE